MRAFWVGVDIFWVVGEVEGEGEGRGREGFISCCF